MQNNNKGSLELSEALFIGGIAILLGLLIFLIQKFSVFVLQPTLILLTEHLKHNARGTGEVLGLGIVLFTGARVYFKMTKELVKTFKSSNEQLISKIEKLEDTLLKTETKNAELTYQLAQETDEINLTKQNLLASNEEIAFCKTEIERLKNPEAFAKKIKEAELNNGKLQLLKNLKTLNVRANR